MGFTTIYDGTQTVSSLSRYKPCFAGGGGGRPRGQIVRLPSDNMTQKQWKERCGKVMTYQLRRPMKWEEFKQMPPDIQKKYIVGLQESFAVNAASLSEMFGVTALTVRRHVIANELGIVFPVGKSMSREQRDLWESFLNQRAQDEQASCEDVSATEERNEVKEEEKRGAMVMQSVRLQFSGDIDVSGIANSLRLILGDNPFGKIEIFCELR